MLKVGLTGGIGSGKSTVAGIFSVLGIPVFDADFHAKKIMNEDEGLKQKIISIFGEDAFTDGFLNRKYIAGIVFNDPLQLEILNNIIHPATIEAAEIWMLQQTAYYVIKEAALLFETGSAANLDYIIGVSAPENIRINRVMKRENMDRKNVVMRINQQIDENIKMRLCNFVIVNDEKQLLIPQVIELHQKLLLLSK
ncbi:MAG: dephospho-CoA kinase [Chitinophagaceae bacterium]